MSTIAFCLLSYRPNHPSGIERSIAALVEGVRRLGHTPLILAAGPAGPDDLLEPGLVRLESVILPRPALNEDVLAALADPAPVVAEVQGILARHRVDAACWADTLWGLGYLNPAPAGVTSALMIHKIRPSGEDRWQRALAAVDVVCPASQYLAEEGAAAGLHRGEWVTVPNALLTDPAPVPDGTREALRREGPIRIASRVEPAKGLAEFLTAMPEDWARPVELVLAEADFEFFTGMQGQVLAACREQAARRPDVVRILPALGWREVPAYLAGAAATVISSTEPETFCHTAAEAMSVGTPVIGFDFGNVPTMTGPAGRAVPAADGQTGLLDALSRLLADPDAYRAASRAAPGRITAFNPEDAAQALLTALGL
ncbi:glycosyltransferase family 4 protein [Kitasatospora sp. NPDC127121]|uniref:glycosyltransferase family 4 protein n=1 Tax=Kitasatospora sp. NPDC127121 TaxID=3345371 RepID=UPI00362694F3